MTDEGIFIPWALVDLCDVLGINLSQVLSEQRAEVLNDRIPAVLANKNIKQV